MQVPENMGVPSIIWLRAEVPLASVNGGNCCPVTWREEKESGITVLSQPRKDIGLHLHQWHIVLSQIPADQAITSPGARAQYKVSPGSTSGYKPHVLGS